jgi:hypothetical protein
MVVAIELSNDRTIAGVTDNCGTPNTYTLTKAKSGTSNGMWHYAAVVAADCLDGTISIDVTGGLPGGGRAGALELISSTGWDATMANNVESTIARTTAADSTMVSGSFNTTQASTAIFCHGILGNPRTTTTLLPTGAVEIGAANDNNKLIYALETTAQTGITCGATLVGGATTWNQDGVVYKDTAPAATTGRRRQMIVSG